MRTYLLLMAVAGVAVSFDRLVTVPSDERASPVAHQQVAQNAGPLPTAAVNPRLGAPPAGGHLGSNPDVAPGATRGSAAGRNVDNAVDAGSQAISPGAPGARLGPMNGNRLGVPPGETVPPPAGVAPAPGAGAVPAPGGAVGAPPVAPAAPGR